MYDLPPSTMFTYAANPMFEPVDISGVPIGAVAQKIDQFKARSKMVHPESDALSFYFLNHAFHVMRTKINAMETLDAEMVEVAETHIRLSNEIAQRLFFYNLVIAVEEAGFIPQQDAGFYALIEDRYGEDFLDFMQKGFSRGSGMTSFGKLKMTCGEFSTAMVATFGFGKWQHGFGGKGWVPIAALASDCIHGRVSFEQMADQSFSLCHNNGSMFNKGKFYHCYTHFIYDILDIQDSGQIPQWIGAHLDSQYVSADLKKLYQTLARRFPEEMTGPVDKSLIKNSAAKREKKAAAVAAHNHATWNSGVNGPGAPAKPAPQQKMNNIINDLIKGGGMF
jgi:hypothetical protein